jgi:hypothetical protein
MTRFRARQLLCCVLFAASCSGDSPTEPTGLTGRYVLATIDFQPLPIIEGITSSGDTLIIVGGTVNVLSRGRVQIVHQGRLHRTAGRPPADMNDTLVQPFRLAGDTVFIDYQSGGLTGPYTDTAFFTPDTFRIGMLVNHNQSGHFWRDMRYIR